MPFIRGSAAVRSLAGGLLVVVAIGIYCAPARGVIRVWDGGPGGTGTDIGVAANWNPDGNPSVSVPDTARFDGTVPGALSLVYQSTAFAGAAGNAGLLLDITSTQTGSLTIDGATGASSIRVNNTAITIASGAGAVTFGNGVGPNWSFTMGGAGSTTQTMTNNSSNAATINSEVALNNGGGGAHTFAFTGSGNWTVNTNVTASSGTVALTKSGAGALTLSGTNGYTGATTVSDGTLRFSGAGSILTSSQYNIGNGAAVLQVDAAGRLGSGLINITSTGGATGSTGRLELSGGISLANNVTLAPRNDPGASDAIRNVSGNNTLSGPINIVTGGTQARIQSDAGTLTLSTGGISTNTTTPRDLYLQGAANGLVSGVISDNPANAAGKINVHKEGTGTWTLNSTNTYTGTTTVSDGALLVNGSNTGAGAVTVNGGTLGGTGSVAGAVTVNSGGTLSPGASIESLGSGAVTFSSGSTFKYEVSTLSAVATGADLLNATGSSLSITSGVSLLALDLNPNPNAISGPTYKYTMIAYSNGGNANYDPGTFAGYGELSVVTFTPGGKQFRIRYRDTSPGGNFSSELTTGGNNRFVTLTAVPELDSLITMSLVGCCAIAAVCFGKRFGYAAFKL